MEDQDTDVDARDRKITLRVPASTWQRLRNHGHARQVAPSVLAALGLQAWVESLGDPGAPPPPLDALGPRAAELLSVLVRLAGNCTQLLQHAERLGAAGVGAPVPAFTALVDVITSTRTSAERLGLEVKAGRIGEDQAAQHLARLATGAEELNALARSLNTGETVTAAVWVSVARTLREITSGQ